MAMKLETVVEGYLRSLAVSAKETSVRTSRAHVSSLYRYLNPRAKASKLNRADIDEFVAARLGEGVTRATVNGGLKTLLAALRWGVDARMIEELPCGVKLLKVGRKIPVTLSEADLGRLLDVADARCALALLIAARSGLRHQEILHLTWRDVDFTESVLRVTGKRGWTTKSHHEREVPMGGELHRALTEAKRSSKSPWLFPGSTPEAPMWSMTLEIRVVFRAADLYDRANKPGLHQLRRTWATELLGRGADIETVRQLGGWADLTTVQRYVGSTDSRKRAAIELLEGKG
jgi:integrase